MIWKICKNLIWKNDSTLSDIRSFNVTEDNATFIWRQIIISPFEMDFHVHMVFNDTITNCQMDLT